MTAQRLRICATLLLAAGTLAFACGQSPKGTIPAGNGQLAIAMVDAPTHAVSEIWVNVTQVRAHSVEAGWVTVSSTPLTVDLLKLQDAAADLGLINLPPGTITQVRLVVAAEGNHVVLPNGTPIPLKVPSGMESGIKIKGPWTVTECQQTALTLDFDGKHSLFVHPAEQGEEWILRPVIRVKKVETVDAGCTDGGGDGGTPGACDETHPCAEGLTCTDGACGGGEPGVPCVLNSECISNACNANVCAPGAPGTPCTAGTSCASGVCDAGTSTCAPSDPGTPCHADADCAAGTCQVDTGECSGTTPGDPGDPCLANSECLSSVCMENLCQGTTCTSDADCTDAAYPYCNVPMDATAGTCTPQPSL